MSKKHELKILRPFADAISRGEKTFEVRKNDRNFEAGDIVEAEKEFVNMLVEAAKRKEGAKNDI